MLGDLLPHAILPVGHLQKFTSSACLHNLHSYNLTGVEQNMEFSRFSCKVLEKEDLDLCRKNGERHMDCEALVVMAGKGMLSTNF